MKVPTVMDLPVVAMMVHNNRTTVVVVDAMEVVAYLVAFVGNMVTDVTKVMVDMV